MTVRASDLKRPLASRLREDRERLRVQGSAATLARSGMSVTAEGEVTVSGDLIVGGELAVHGSAAFDGNTTIGGNAAITGTLSLPAGIINNDALTSPVYPFVGHAQGNNFTLSTTNTAKATLTVPVPAGYTSAMVTANAHVSAFNPTADSDYLYAVAWIQSDTTIGWSMPTTIPAGESAHTSQTATALLSGLGSSFTVKVATSTAFQSFASSTSGNVCNIDATVLFLR